MNHPRASTRGGRLAPAKNIVNPDAIIIRESVTTAVSRLAEPWCDYRDPRPELEDIDASHARADARAPVYGNLDWSTSLAHGADMLFPITEVARRMLSRESGERIILMERIRFAGPVRGDIDIRVCDGKSPGMDSPNVIGAFITSTGRRLRFEAKTDVHTTIRQLRNGNIASYELSRSIPCGNAREFSPAASINASQLQSLGLTGGSMAMRISTFADILTHWSSEYFTRCTETLCPDYQDEAPSKLLVVRIDNMPTEPDLAILCDPSQHIGLSVHPATRPLSSGMRTIAFVYSIPGLTPVTMHLAYSMDPEVVAAFDAT